ncbi:hypothetical protein LDC_3010, partial [sediment metagenome]
MTTQEDKKNPSVSKIKVLYNNGEIEQAVVFAHNLAKEKPELLKNATFALLYAQILIEAAGPSGQIKSILIHAINE